MAEKQPLRNFRSFYYEKLEVRGVEEKKSIEILMDEKPLDVERLSQFCLMFPVPAANRTLIWKVILDVLPRYPGACHEFCTRQITEQYQDLHRAIRILKLVREVSPKPDQFLQMFLIEERKLKLKRDVQYSDPPIQQFMAIATVLCKTQPNDVDAYWLTKHFYKLTRKFVDQVAALTDQFLEILKMDDEELFRHLTEMGALEVLPFQKWFCCCFAGTIHVNAIEKIWDVVIGGSTKILAYVACSILTGSRYQLMAYKTPEEVRHYAAWLTEENSEKISNLAIGLWTTHGEARKVKN